MTPPSVIDLAVVTSCHNYGRYIGDWARSLAGMTVWPRRVALVDNGSTDGTWAQMNDVADKLRAIGLAEVIVERIPLADFGTARNRAVELGGDTEWVMHMDADDTFMPHCLSDVSALMPLADVIPLGYERSGDLAAGPRNRTRIYSSTQGPSTLQSSAPASGVSPFRRTFWERSPYRTDMSGGWDTALWIGFAHLNARFVAVRRPCFYYRQHADSIFNTRRLDLRQGQIVGAKLQSLRDRRSGVSILVPRRSDNGGARDRAWAWVRERYARLYPDWEVVEGYDGGEGPWRKGLAARDAFAKSRGRTLVIADSDCVVSQGALEEAVMLVEDGEANWVIPHTLVKRLTQEATDTIIASPDLGQPLLPDPSLVREPYVGFPGGGFIVVDAAKWSASWGIPPSFAGWGAEDEATAEILSTLIGPPVRLEYDLWHLWHPHAKKSGGDQSNHRQNRTLLNLIRSLAGDPDAMFALLARLESGATVDSVWSVANGKGGSILMVAIEDFKRGTQAIKKNERFIATEEEAKRHEARPRKIAIRASTAPIAILRGGRDRTLDIRAEQRERNREAVEDRDKANTNTTNT